jgi:hypothetical protein
MLYIPGGLITLLGNPGIPAPIIPFHGVEILADSIVYGLVLSRVLRRKLQRPTTEMGYGDRAEGSRTKPILERKNIGR